MKLTPIHVVLVNQIRPVHRVLLSCHLYHRVHPFQAFQAGLATSLHRHHTHFPFLDRIAKDHDEIIISRKGAISFHNDKNNNNMKLLRQSYNRYCSSNESASNSPCVAAEYVSFDLWNVSKTDANSDIIAAAHYVTSAHKILIIFVSGEERRGNSKERRSF